MLCMLFLIDLKIQDSLCLYGDEAHAHTREENDLIVGGDFIQTCQTVLSVYVCQLLSVTLS